MGAGASGKTSLLQAVEEGKIIILSEKAVRAVPASMAHGKDANTLLGELLDCPGRQPAVSERIQEAYAALNRRDLEEAGSLAEELKDKLGSDDLEVIAMTTKLALAKWKRGLS